MLRLYRPSTQLVCYVTIPAALTLAFFSEQVLWAWTGNIEVASKASPVLALYALGNGILALGACPYQLQFAKGNLKLHMIGSGLFVVLLIPALIWATLKYGATGAGYAWLGANIIYFFTWVPKVHSRFLNGLHLQWLLRDVGTLIFFALLAAVVVHSQIKWPQERMQVAIGILLISVVLLFISAASSSMVRNAIHAKWQTKFTE